MGGGLSNKLHRTRVKGTSEPVHQNADYKRVTKNADLLPLTSTTLLSPLLALFCARQATRTSRDLIYLLAYFSRLLFTHTT